MHQELVRAENVCSLAGRWGIHPDLAEALVRLAQDFAERASAAGVRWDPELYIISGFRPPSYQTQINPAVSNSGHERCPAVAVDLRVGGVPASLTPREVWAALGTLWKARNPGARWGGDFSTPDMNHFDDPSLDPSWLG